VGVRDYSSGGRRTVAVRVTAIETGCMCVCESVMVDVYLTLASISEKKPVVLVNY
jgi:hypothetical protein